MTGRNLPKTKSHTLYDMYKLRFLSAKKCFDKCIGVEFCDVVRFFAEADEFHREDMFLTSMLLTSCCVIFYGYNSTTPATIL